MIGNRIGVNYEPPEKTNFPIGSGKMPVYATVGSAIDVYKRQILNKKHILVEKSITLNSDELSELIALADENNVVIGEAMTVYHMPIYKNLNEILKSGTLGRVNLITMNFGSFKEYNMKNRFFNRRCV